MEKFICRSKRLRLMEPFYSALISKIALKLFHQFSYGLSCAGNTFLMNLFLSLFLSQSRPVSTLFVWFIDVFLKHFVMLNAKFAILDNPEKISNAKITFKYLPRARPSHVNFWHQFWEKRFQSSLKSSPKFKWP